jgi:actin related protein 2/3 complex subunit 5
LTLQTLLLILNSTKPADISPIVKALSSESQDTLMKYLYKAMAMPGYADVNSSALLTWHEKVRRDLLTYAQILIPFQLTEVAGIGCIVRVMTDRKTV